MPFKTDSVVTKTSDGRNHTLLEPLVYVTEIGTVITVPIGTETDGCSTPPGIWTMLPPFGLYWRAAVVHDYLYRRTYFPKDYCDDIFLEAMKSLGVPKQSYETIYHGVKYGGWKAFDEDRKELDAMGGPQPVKQLEPSPSEPSKNQSPGQGS